MNTESKKTYPQSREHHFVVPMPLEEAAEYIPHMRHKRIKVSVEKATPEERNFRLDYDHLSETRVYVRLSVWNATETRVEMSLSKRFLPPHLLILITLAVSVLTIIGFAIEGTRPFSFLIFFCAFIFLIFYLHFNQNNITKSTKQEIMLMNRNQKTQGYIMDAIIEVFKNEGATALMEHPTSEIQPLPKKPNRDPEIPQLDDDARSSKAKRD